MKLKTLLIIGLVFVWSNFKLSDAKKQKVTNPPTVIEDNKAFKKLLRTKNNVLVCFFGPGTHYNIVGILNELSEEIKGRGTVAFVHCESTGGQKICKRLKIDVKNTNYVIKHYKKGEFHLNYERAEKLPSFINFMNDPTGEVPWEEVDTSKDVKHIIGQAQFSRTLKKGKSLVMFYAPWCGFCKRMKPDFEKAATETLDWANFAAVDVTKPQNTKIAQAHNITGYPTLVYYNDGVEQYVYPGDNKKDPMIKFLRNPSPVQEKPANKDEDWSSQPSDVNHLTSKTFNDFINDNSNVLIIFYAPWCGHCKNLKPKFEKAATTLKNDGIQGKLAAVDCTKEMDLAKKYDVSGYPTLIFFKDGEQAFVASHLREENAIVNFMKDPKEPPPPPPPETPWEDQETDVVHLTDENFRTTLKKRKHALVMFYAPWCGHCKNAKPEFNVAAEEFNDNPQISLAAVDCTKHKTTCSQFDVKGFPTFKYFRYYNVEPVKDYNGGRKAIDFIKFLKNPDESTKKTQTIENSQWQGILHLTNDNFDSFLKRKDHALIAFYAPWCDHCKAMKKDFIAAAQEVTRFHPDALLAAVDSTEETELANRFTVKGFPTIKYFQYGKFLNDYHGNRKKNDFIKFFNLRHKEEL